jgi:hypothetical protein
MRLAFLRNAERNAPISAMDLFKDKQKRIIYFGQRGPICEDGYPLQHMRSFNEKKSILLNEDGPKISIKPFVKGRRKSFNLSNSDDISPYSTRLSFDKWPFQLFGVVNSEKKIHWLEFADILDSYVNVDKNVFPIRSTDLPPKSQCVIDRCDIHLMASLEACESLAYGIASTAQAGGFLIDIHKGFGSVRKNINGILDLAPLGRPNEGRASISIFDPVEILSTDGDTAWALRVFYYDCDWPEQGRGITVIDHLKTNAVTVSLDQFSGIMSAISYLGNVGIGSLAGDIIDDHHVEELNKIAKRMQFFDQLYTDGLTAQSQRQAKIEEHCVGLYGVFRRLKIKIAQRLVACGAYIEARQKKLDFEYAWRKSPDEIIVIEE